MSKVIEKRGILKATREKQFATYKGNPIRLGADFLAESLQVTRDWHDIFEVLGTKPRNQ